MKVVLTIAGLDPEYGGPSHSVPALAEALARASAKVELITCENAAGQGAPRLPDAQLVTTQLLPFANRSTCWRARGNHFSAALIKEGTPADTIIHDNGLWLPNNHAVAVTSRELHCPLIVSPRGMLSAWAMRFKGLKKQMAWWLYQRRDLQSAKVLHATSGAEAAEFRAMGLKQAIAVIPNGVDLPPPVATDHQPPTTNHHTLLFLSRIHPKKGLLDLVHAWAKVSSQWSVIGSPSRWHVVIAGSDEAGHTAELKAEIGKLKLESDFEFVGAVEGAVKWELYRRADLFVLPSHSENFGIVIAEALACGVPVITTRGTPWEDLLTHCCGWWMDIGSEPLATALREATTLSDEARRAMGLRGQQLVESKYSWASAAEQMLAVYRWMLGARAKPDCVLTTDG